MTIDSLYLDIAALPDDLLVLTPNRRLAAWLDRDHDQLQQSRGLTSWPRINAQPLDQWLQQLFEEICLAVPLDQAAPRLLSSSQSALIWKQVLEQHWEQPTDIEGLAALAQQARSLLMRWCWQPEQWQSAFKREQQEFARWHQAYCDALKRQNALDQAGLLQWVMAHGESLRTALPRTLYLHGFNDLEEPQLQQLTRWLQADGIQVFATTIPQRGGDVERVDVAQADDQFAQAIQWALAQRASQPAMRIGVVIPNLQPMRARIRALCQHLWSLQPDADQHHWTEIINITAAQTLADYPLVSQLLLWLRGLTSELSLQEWHLLLTSPYVCRDEAEWLQRDGFFQWLRGENRKQFYLAALGETWIKRCGQDDTAAWLTQLQQLRCGGRQSIERWIGWFRRFVALISSRQGRSLDSEEFQLQQRLHETVVQLQELGDWLGDIDLGRFRNELQAVLENTQFQPQTETAPIQVMGILEAAGLGFDALWVCELEAANWPQPLNPNPLLSRPLQRAMNMPGASPERELLYASRLLDGFRQAADQVIFSWGHLQGDTEHTCSALISDLQPSPRALSDLSSPEQLQFDQQAMLIETVIADEFGSPVQDHHAKGGSGIIKSQSLCPFKAFAEYRLGVRAEDELADGIKASDRGSLLHKVMESVWRDLKDSGALQALMQNEERLDRWLNDIIDGEMKNFRQQVFLQPDALYQLERLRTFNIARRWLLQCDGTRPPFSVAQVEKRRQLTISGLQLNLTVDRMDELPDGDLLIVDYKSGEKDAKAWLGERPEEPQLPLYTLLEPERTKGVLFGILKPDALGYKGLLEEKDQIATGKANGLKEPDDWNEQMAEWRRILEQLANEYREGRAAVAPLNEQACTYCHLAPVCRIREVTRDSD